MRSTRAKAIWVHGQAKPASQASSGARLGAGMLRWRQPSPGCSTDASLHRPPALHVHITTLDTRMTLQQPMATASPIVATKLLSRSDVLTIQGHGVPSAVNEHFIERKEDGSVALSDYGHEFFKVSCKVWGVPFKSRFDSYHEFLLLSCDICEAVYEGKVSALASKLRTGKIAPNARAVVSAYIYGDGSGCRTSFG